MSFSVTNDTAGRSSRFSCAWAPTLAAGIVLYLSAAGVFAQAPTKQDKPAQQIKEDVKGAAKAADQGDTAAATGKIDEALARYDAAVRLAPGDIGIRRRAAGVRAVIVQKIVDQAEAKALDGRVD